MAQKKLNINPNAYKAKKIQVVRENPANSVVYVFNSPIIRDRFAKITREAAYIKEAVMELWGFQIGDEDKKAIEEKFNKVLETARKIIEFTKEFGDVDYSKLLATAVNTKIRLINRVNSPMVEVFVSNDEDEDILFEALIRIDTFNDRIKRSNKAKEWIELLNEFEKALKELKDFTFNIFKDKVRAKYLIKWTSLRNEFRRFLKENAAKQ